VSNFSNGKEPNKSVNPNKAVAYGTAAQAAILSKDTSEKTEDLLLDVAPPSLSIETSKLPPLLPQSTTKCRHCISGWFVPPDIEPRVGVGAWWLGDAQKMKYWGCFL
jgi:hypothetical protein